MKKPLILILFVILFSFVLKAQNYAFNFSNRTDIVTIGSTDIAPPWTAEMWVYKKATTAYSSLVNGTTSKINLEVWNGGQKVGLTKKGVADWTFPTAYVVPLTTWTHLAFVCNGAKTYLYVNGLLKDSLAQSISLPMTSLGNAVQSESPNIYMDEVRFWKTVRKPADILANKNGSVNPMDQNLIAYWYADDRATPAVDISANARICPLSGTTYITNTNTSFVTSFADMSILNTKCENVNQYLVTPGSTNQELLQIAIEATGVSNPKNVTSITVNLNGTSAISDLSSVRLFSTGPYNTFSATQQFGAAVSPSNGDLTFTGNQVLSQGMNYFWVAADVKPTANIGNSVDAECSNVMISGVTIMPTSTSPQGKRNIFAAQKLNSVDGINIIPKPMSLEVKEGTFTLNSATQIVASDVDAKIEADFMAAFLAKPTGYSFATSVASPAQNSISLTIVNDPALKTEGYRLNVLADRIVIEANNRIGLFWAFQTLRQLLPAKIEAQSVLSGFAWSVPQVTITDAPVYQHRGSMLDVCRHIFSVQEVKRFIDMLAFYKMNVFHWHLAEDQGFRIESKKYPKLNTISSWRTCNPDMVATDSKPYGGYYTQDQIRDIVAFATARHVEVIPELEFPGHSVEVLAAFPELGCTSGTKPYSVRCGAGVSADMYCAGKDTVMRFIKNLLDEVVPLFPGSRFHIGSDETPFDKWSTCTDCLNRITSLGLTGGATTNNLHTLKKYFTDQIIAYLGTKGKSVIGWTELAAGGYTQGTTIQDWIGGSVGAVQNGCKAIISHTGPFYFDGSQSDSSTEPASFYSNFSLEKVYAKTIMPSGLTSAQQALIIGAEAPLWTELIATNSHLEYMLCPRLQALAENTWTQDSRKNIDDFKARLYPHFERMDSLKFNNRKLDTPIAQTAPISIASCSSAVLVAPSKASSYYWTDATNAQTSTVSVTTSGSYRLYSNFLGKSIITNYDVTIKPTVVKPNISTTINSDTIVTATGNADNYHWYDAATAGNQLATATSITTSANVQTKKLWVSGSQNLQQTSLNLSGSNYMSCSPLNLTTNTVTFEAWVKANGTQNDVAGIMFDRGSSAFGLSVRSNGQLMYHWNNNFYGWNSGLTLPDNTWVHVALVITPTSATIYLNDRSATNTATHTAGALLDPLYVGFDSGNRYFKGQIDEVRVWSTALTKEQIMRNSAVQLTGAESNLEAYFNMNDGAGSSTANVVNGSKVSIINPTGSDWLSANPCPVLNINCESERWPVGPITAIEINKYTRFEVFPNPNSGSFTTIMNGENINSYSVKWYDIAGKEMNFVAATTAASSNQIKKQYQDVPKGVYIMSIVVNNQAIKTAKVIVE